MMAVGGSAMATNDKPGKGRKGAVKNRSQFKHSNQDLWVKRENKYGKILDVKTTGGRFKGIRREK
jgi:hypothetical protein